MTHSIFHALNVQNSIQYLSERHGGAKINTVNMVEYLLDATPVIEIQFQWEYNEQERSMHQMEGFTVTHSPIHYADMWLELQDSGERHLYGEW